MRFVEEWRMMLEELILILPRDGEGLLIENGKIKGITTALGIEKKSEVGSVN
jgi:tRNA uridine 5-carboxymethylaminomethyl modification enzyme